MNKERLEQCKETLRRNRFFGVFDIIEQLERENEIMEKWQEKCHIFSVAWELTEIRNACGEPRSSVKQENELTSAS